MNDELDPLTLGDTPEEYIENEDGSVEIPLDEGEALGDSEFLSNLAEVFSEATLNFLSGELTELVEKDKKSREKRDKQYEEGLRRTGLGDDAPGGAEFDGASKVVHPVLAEACVDFSSRAIKELFPASGPVKPWVNGDVTPRKLEKASRKTRFMNWQLTTQIKEYRDELEQLLTQLPMGGSQYQKFWFDEKKKRICNEFVPVDEIFLPYSATNFYTSPRATHRQLISRATFRSRVKSGLYRDVFVPDATQYPEESASTKANDKIEGREEDGYNEDGLRAVLEIYCWQELEEDSVSGGEYAPYIITIDEDTEKVLSIYRNWDENDPTLEKLEWIVEWKFIPWRGAYAIGLPHLIGGLSAALTGTLRALLDSAHINNAPTMLKLKSGRIVGQNTQVNVTQVCDIEGPAGIDDIKKLAMAMPFNPPSSVLHQLMQDLYGMAKGVVSTAEEKIGQIGDRTPVGTTMALIEQGSNTYSAIHSRLHESQKRALAIIHRLNATYLEDMQVEELNKLAISREDFAGTLDVIPVSDPTIFSEAQRFAQSQAILQMAVGDAQNPNIPWNQVAVRRRMLKQMRIENIDELLPPEQEEVTADVLTENTQGLKGSKLKAAKEQDHMAHVSGHISFVEAPMQMANPLIAPQALMALLGHIEEHIQMFSAQVTAETARQLAPSMAGASEDTIFAAATAQAGQIIAQAVGPILQRIGAVQQQLQQRMPKPEMPPEVQASLQIAQMDTQRKTQYDQGMLQLKQAELQMRQGEMQAAQQKDVAEFQSQNTLVTQKMQMQAADIQARQAVEAQKLQLQAATMQFEQQLKMSREQFEQQLKAEREANEARLKELAQQVELLKNREDNERARYVDLLKNQEDNARAREVDLAKNRADNETRLIIASMQSDMEKPE